MMRRTFDPIHSGDVTYLPFYDSGRVGYEIRFARGGTTHVYFNPSDHTDDGEPNVFVYVGEANDPAVDEPRHFYEISRPRDGSDHGRAGQLTSELP